RVAELGEVQHAGRDAQPFAQEAQEEPEGTGGTPAFTGAALLLRVRQSLPQPKVLPEAGVLR
ncbi:unnamed protein product, partial [Ectocarpus fasciculatus]